MIQSIKRRVFKKSHMRIVSRVLSVILVTATLLSIVSFAGNALSYHTIRINYYYIDGSPAHDPYIATFTVNSPVDLEVNNPNIDGFIPMVLNEGETDPLLLPGNGSAEASTSFDYGSLEEDVTKSVYYVAGLSHYSAKYYKQNIYDDLYTLDRDLTAANKDLYGVTGESPDSLEAVEIEGFTNLFHEPDAIAADGSTVFKVYYDRNYYTVGFNLGDGGYGVEPVYAKYQTVYHLTEPKRLGYTFKGWLKTDEDSSKGEYGTDWRFIDESGNELVDGSGNPLFDENGDPVDENSGAESNYIPFFNEGTVPARDTYYKAVWKKGTTSYSIVYWIEKPNGTRLTREQIEDTANVDEARALISANYSVVVARDFKNVQPGTKINLHSIIQNARGEDMELYDLFAYDLTNTVNFPMSDATREELVGKEKYYDFNEDLSMLQFNGVHEDDPSKEFIEVSGDGTTRINVYYNRAEFTLKFYYAKEDSSGKLYLTSGTGGFSKKTDRNLRTRLNSATWKQVNVSLPTIDPKYSSQIPGSCLGVDELNGDKFYYYEKKCLYGADMSDVWFNDAFSTIPGVFDGVPYRFTSWAVEYGTKFYYDHVTANNFTVKGFYEKLGDDLLFRDFNDNGEATETAEGYGYRELHYVASWSGVSSGVNSEPYCFTYKNYVRLLPYEEDIITEMGYDTGVSELISRGNYIDIITNNGRHYGLTEDNKVETFDWGAGRYTGTGITLARAVKANQTAVDLTGFKLVDESDVENIYTGSGMLNPQSTWYAYDVDGDGTNDFDAKHHADVVFLYDRKSYTLKYRNHNILEKQLEVYYNAPLNQDTFGYTPTYPYSDLVDYYTFAGWYYTPYYYRQVYFSTEKMPADDLTLYAKWVAKKINVSFYNSYNDYYMRRNELVLDKVINEDGTEKDVTALPVEYGSYIPIKNIPVDDPDPENPRPKLTPISEGATFAGWYYIRNRMPVRFEPEKVHVTALNEESAGENGTLRLFAEWVTKDVAKYKISYVEKNNHEKEVAAPTEGRAFVSKTKTFNAKSPDELYDEYKWTAEASESGTNWWPTTNSHSIIIKSNEQGEEFEPNTTVFEYIQKDSVYYRVQYLNAATRTPLNPSGEDVIKQSTHASVKEDALVIPKYIVREASQSVVLVASDADDPEQQRREELENNVITFLYYENENDVLYEAEYYTQNTDGTTYSLNRRETLTQRIAAEGDTTVSIAALIGGSYVRSLEADGFTRKAGAVTYTVTDTEGNVSEPQPVADDGFVTLTNQDKKTIRIYLDRNTYQYGYQYIDHSQEKLYEDMKRNGEDVTNVWNGVIEENLNAGTGLTDQVITLSPAATLSYNGLTYVRTGSGDASLTIQPSDEAPGMNLLKIYYKKETERRLEYKMVCVNKDSIGYEADTDPVTGDELFGRLSINMQTVQSFEGIRDVTFTNNNDEIARYTNNKPVYLHDHRYTFLGWYTTPEYDPEHPEANRLTEDEVLTKELLQTNGGLPESDSTYYALVSQDMIKSNVEIRYTDDYSTENFLALEQDPATEVVRNAAADPTGEHVGSQVKYSAPSRYENNTPIAYHRSDGFSLYLERADDLPLLKDDDGNWYRYQFAEWWEVEDNNNGNLIRRDDWHSTEEEYASQLTSLISRQNDSHIVAMFARRYITPVTYTINYVYQGRKGGNNGSYIGDDAATDEKIYTVSVVVNPDEWDENEMPVSKILVDNAPEIDDLYKDCVWTIDDGHVSFDKATHTVTVTAVQNTKIYHVEFRDSSNNTFKVYSATINSLVMPGGNYVEAPESDGSNPFAYWSVTDKKTGKELSRCFNRQFDLRVTGDIIVTACYTEEAERVFIGDPTYSREKTTDSSGKVTDKLYADFILAFTEKDGKLLNPKYSDHVTDTYTTGLILEYDQNIMLTKPDSAGATLSDEDKATAVYSDNLSVENAKLLAQGQSASGTTHRYVRYSITNDKYSNRNRVNKSISFNNTESMRHLVFRAYYYVWNTSTGDFELTDPVCFYLYDIGNSVS